ncbi:MAG TPA: S8 family serine peptidase [Gaiellaceae bacterium]|nr:S8 family serine peptidase [Gaiellaceae bacterium]
MRLRLGLGFAAAAALAAICAASAAAFTPSNPYYAKQWYLAEDHAFDYWPSPPTFQAQVEVAVIDSGVDCSLPDFQGRIAAARSFVGGSACTDTQGHGTIVAGEIAGDLDSAGIVGLSYAAQLVVAKVVEPDGTIPLRAEAAAIRWAVNRGARVVNLSLGGVRDPVDPRRDTYSKLEAQAVAYAWRKGAVVVAAAGNADEAYATPWPWASWPAALPHVLGVAALTRSGGVPEFSDRDPVFVDLAAPGVDIFSTFPRALTAAQPGCAPQGYTACASGDYQQPEGTSFAAPQVSAAAAVLFGLDPSLTNSQVATLLERTADDVDAATGCAICPVGRDRYSGWGRLDVARAVARLESGRLPPPDRFEPNDDVSEAYTLWGRRRAFVATLDYWDDPVDVYRVKLLRGQRLSAWAHAQWAGGRIRLTLWAPGTKTVLHGHGGPRSIARSAGGGATQRLAYRVRRSGWYFLELQAPRPGGGAYALRLTKRG